MRRVWSCYEYRVIWSWPIYKADFPSERLRTCSKAQAPSSPEDIGNVQNQKATFFWVNREQTGDGRENEARGNVESMKSEKEEAECRWFVVWTEMLNVFPSTCFLCTFSVWALQITVAHRRNVARTFFMLGWGGKADVLIKTKCDKVWWRQASQINHDIHDESSAALKQTHCVDWQGNCQVPQTNKWNIDFYHGFCMVFIRLRSDDILLCLILLPLSSWPWLEN